MTIPTHSVHWFVKEGEEEEEGEDGEGDGREAGYS